MAAPRTLAMDSLDAGGGLEVVLLDGAGFTTHRPREPHRHAYHELVWVRTGEGEHVIDGSTVPVRPGTVTVIGRGQVHVFQRAQSISGAVVRFGDEVLRTGESARIGPEWLLAGRGGRSVAVAAHDRDRLDGLIAALAREVERPPDRVTDELERHLLAVLLLWLERWYDASRTERREADDAEVELHRRFSALLETQFAAHHGARHYADALGLPQAALSHALTRVTGRGTKELVTDRVMVEARRLLRFTDLTVGQIAHQVGFRDQLYFSRAFKRAAGEAPVAYRERFRGA
jgi:AraC family transcriptional activator of pobA